MLRDANRKPTCWAIVTGAYPPEQGGVSDYAWSLANGLAYHGDEVHVWAPSAKDSHLSDGGVTTVHRLADQFGPLSLVQMSREIGRLPPAARMLVQYVPHAFGFKAMNVPFCWWVGLQARRMRAWVMFHEVAFPVGPGQSRKHNLLGHVNRYMAATVARSAERVFVSIPGWEPLLRELVPTIKSLTWLPVPSNLPTVAPQAEQVRSRYSAAGRLLVGHFGTFGSIIAGPLEQIVLALVASNRPYDLLLIGRGSVEFLEQLVNRYPGIANRVNATGGLAPKVAADHLAACDMLIQPYPDGVSSRRGTTMAGLALGVPTITNRGPLTEAFWSESGAVVLVDAPSATAFTAAVESLSIHTDRRAEIGWRARTLYNDRYGVERTIDTLRNLAAHG